MESNFSTAPPLLQHRRTIKLMGNMFSFNVVHDDEQQARALIDKAVAEIQRIERLLTTFNEASQTNQINQNAGIRPVKVDREVFELVERSIKISDLTQGAFDLTYGSIDKSLWNFDQSMKSLPDRAVARKMVYLIDYRNIILDHDKCSIMLKNKGMRIGFGGIGKGYAADRAKMILQACGVESGIVNASGDLSAWGVQQDGAPWQISIADPDSRIPFTTFPLHNMSVATSGSYEKFITINGKRYSHTIDPKTGFPATGIKSVTVISPIAELSDALATPVTVMGVTPALNMINQMKGVGCIIIDDQNVVHTSSNISIQKQKQ